MKKMMLALVAFCVLCACSGERTEFPDYRGLPLNMSYKAFYDTLVSQGFQLDSAHSTDGLAALAREGEVNFGLSVKYHADTIDAVQESYTASYNDSTRQLWQTLRDSLEKKFDKWPNAPILKDDHKLAEFEHKGGMITVLLQNTYTPTLLVLYEKTYVKK